MGRKNKKAIQERKEAEEKKRIKLMIIAGAVIAVLALALAIFGVYKLVQNKDNIDIEDTVDNSEEQGLEKTPFVKLVRKLVKSSKVSEYYLFQSSALLKVEDTSINMTYDDVNLNINISAEFDLDEDDNIIDEFKEDKLNTLLDIAYTVAIMLYGEDNEKFIQYCLGEHVNKFRYAKDKIVFGVTIGDEQVDINKIHISDVDFSGYTYEGINIGTGVKAGYINNFGYAQIAKVNDSLADTEAENRGDYALEELNGLFTLQGDLWKVQVNPDSDKSSEVILQDTIRGIAATYNIKAEGKTYKVVSSENVTEDEGYMGEEILVVRLKNGFNTGLRILGKDTTDDTSEMYYIVVNRQRKE